MTYMLGTTHAGIADIKTIVDDIAADPFPAPFQDFSEVSGMDCNGAPVKSGLPRCTWHWDWMTRADYTALKAYVGHCHIETNEGDDTYADFGATLSFPEEPQPIEGHRCGPVDAQFTMLVLDP